MPCASRPVVPHPQEVKHGQNACSVATAQLDQMRALGRGPFGRDFAPLRGLDANDLRNKKPDLFARIARQKYLRLRALGGVLPPAQGQIEESYTLVKA